MQRSRAYLSASLLAALLSTVCLTAHAGKLQVVDESYSSDFALYLEETLPAPLQAALVQRGLAVWGRTEAYELGGHGYCIGSVGITTATTDGRQPRAPLEHITRFVQEVADDQWQETVCRATAMRAAVEAMGETELAQLVDNLDQTLPGGGTRAVEAADPKVIEISGSGVGAKARAALSDALSAYQIGKLFDYRQITTYVDTEIFELDNGDSACYARVGLTARAPQGRQSRLPAYSTDTMFVAAPGDDEACQRDAVLDAVGKHFSQPWTTDGIFAGLEKTREDGLALPDLAKVAEQHAAQAEPAAAK